MYDNKSVPYAVGQLWDWFLHKEERADIKDKFINDFVDNVVLKKGYMNTDKRELAELVFYNTKVGVAGEYVCMNWLKSLGFTEIRPTNSKEDYKGADLKCKNLKTDVWVQVKPALMKAEGWDKYEDARRRLKRNFKGLKLMFYYTKSHFKDFIEVKFYTHEIIN